MSVRAGVIIPAAGSGRRMGGAHKPLLELEGQPLLLHTLRPFLAFPEVAQVVVALPETLAHDPPVWLPALDERITVVAGGGERGDSVRQALAALDDRIEVVLVHDAVRPLVSPALVGRALAAAGEGRSVVPAVPVTDTIQEVDVHGRILATPSRERLRAAQTPQAFPRAVLADAYARAAVEGVAATDDATLVARCGVAVEIIEGEIDNIKVTTPGDLELATMILRRRSTADATATH